MSLSAERLRVVVMKLINSVVKHTVQTARNTARNTARTPATEGGKALTPKVDSFNHGVKVSVGAVEAHSTVNAHGVSVKFGDDTFGASFRLRDGAATLGAVAIKLGQREAAIGLAPAAPAPLPVPVYFGKPRDE